MPTEVAKDLPTRLRKAAAEARDAQKAAELRLEQRDELIVEAIDREGMTQKAVAALVGFTPGRIHAILLRRHRHEDDG